MPPPGETLAGTPLDLAGFGAHIHARRLAGPFHYHFRVGSTNSAARELAEGGAPEGAVVIAETQTAGRGRLGRRWESPPYANLYISVLLRPRLAPRHAPQLTLTAAVALAETLREVLGRRPEIKWPNDLLIGGRKVAGILTEAACDTQRVQYAILGIGLNVNSRHETMPAALRGRATSLADAAGKFLSRESVLARLIHDLDRCYGELEDAGFDSLRPRWEACFSLRGRLVRAEHDGRAIVGRAAGIDPEGGLIVEGETGERSTIVAGDVIPVES